ncbi:unnamed protein product [Moneuplotes crassus]|uniref:Uncharacterized protein n=1 Tax=Euplotes crassus TaxID=5936 RepID=A0AAD2CZS7_EUPCR|nr:unnamed protein product [Moneuplotes crassus]
MKIFEREKIPNLTKKKGNLKKQPRNCRKWILLLLLFKVLSIAKSKCFLGFFQNGEVCEQCSSECEEYMYLNQTSLLCESCPDNQYYNAIRSICMDCEGSCLGPCMRQSKCWECLPGKVLELNSLECVDISDYEQTNLSSPELLLEGGHLNLSPVVRNFGIMSTIEYYVDICSSQPIELGTLRYPYRSFKAVSYEILSFYSNSDISVTIYTKDGYIEDDTNIYINMSSVQIVPHPDYNESILTPTLIPTSTPIYFFEKTLFHLLTPVASIKDLINLSDFDDYEKSLIMKEKTTILPIRTSFSIRDINIYREESDPDSFLTFLLCGTLNSKGIHIENVNLNITGSFIQTQRPMNLVMKNIRADLARQEHLYFAQGTNCNYPEADLSSTLIFDNLSFVNSNVNNGRASQSVIALSGSENVTATNIDCRNWFTYEASESRCFSYRLLPTCIPSDSLSQILNVVNITNDLVQSEVLPNTKSSNILMTVYPHYRNMHFKITNLTVQNVQITIREAFIGLLGSLMDTFSITDSSITNCTSTSYMIGTMFSLRGTYSNLTFSHIHSNPGAFIGFLQSLNATFTNLQILNYTSPKLGSLPPLDLIPLPTSTVTFTGLKILNSVLYITPLFTLKSPPKKIIVQDSLFEDLRLDAGVALFRFFRVRDFVFRNHTVKGTRCVKEEGFSAFVQVMVVDVEGEGQAVMEDVQVGNSTVGLMEISAVSGGNEDRKVLRVRNIRYAGCRILHSMPLVSTKGVISESLFQIQMEFLEFEDILYENSGDIITFGHQLSYPATVNNLTLSGVESGRIDVKSFNTKFLNFKTSVKFQNLATNNASSSHKSLIRTSLGADVEITNSSFTNIENIYLDSGIFSTESDSIIKIQGTTFQNNSAVSSSIFKIKDESVLKCIECAINNNFAISSGVVST